MFAQAVVVGRDRAGPHVDALAQVGVADVAEVVGLAAVIEVAVFDFHEIADAAVRLQPGARPQLAVGTDGTAIPHLGAAHHREQHLHPTSQLAVFQQAARADAAAIADLVAAAKVALGFDDHVAAEAGAIAKAAAGRIDKGHPLPHPVLPQALLQDGLALGELQAVVDAIDLIGIGHLQVDG